MSTTAKVKAKENPFTNATEISIAAEMLHRYPANRTPTQEAVTAMHLSIVENGQLQPITARLIKNEDGKDQYQIVFGETRVLACQAISPKHPVRCYVVALDDQEAAKIHAIENFQRKQLDAIEEAQAMENMRANGWEVNAIADTLGVTRKTVSHRLRLLKLDDAGRAALREGAITVHVAEAIALLPQEDHQQALDLCLKPSHSSEPLSQRDALRQIEQKIIAPRKRAEKWEARKKELEKKYKGSEFLDYPSALAADAWSSEYEAIDQEPEWALQSDRVRNGKIKNMTWGALAEKWGAQTYIGLPWNGDTDGEPTILVKYQPLIDAELAACEKDPMKCIFIHPAQKKQAELEKQKEEQKEAAEKAALKEEFKEALLIVSRPESIQPAAAERLVLEFFKIHSNLFDFVEGLLPGFENSYAVDNEEAFEKLCTTYLKTKSIRGFEALGRLFVLSQLDLSPQNYNARTLGKILIGTKALKEKDFPLITQAWKDQCAEELAEAEEALKKQGEQAAAA